MESAAFSRRTPKAIFDAHPPDQDAHLRLDLRSPSPWARLPTPVAAKSGSVPTHERLGPDDCENLQDYWKAAIQLDEEPAREPNATTRPAPQDNQLMSKHRVLGFKPQHRPQWRGQDGQSEAEQPDHPASLGNSNAASHSDEISGTHSGTRKVTIIVVAVLAGRQPQSRIASRRIWTLLQLRNWPKSLFRNALKSGSG
jgi:hypothetical protein